MTPSERHAWVAGTFSDRVDGVRDWEAPAPVPGWVARDVVAHLVEWIPGFLSGGGVELVSDGPPVAEDPVRAWHAHAAAVQALLGTLGDPWVRAQLAALGGYDTTRTGEVVGELAG